MEAYYFPVDLACECWSNLFLEKNRSSNANVAFTKGKKVLLTTLQL